MTTCSALSPNAALCSPPKLSEQWLHGAGCIRLVFSAFPNADLSFLFPVHLFYSSFVRYIHVSVGVLARVLFLRLRSGSFHLRYPRCVCTFPRRRSCCRGCGPRCWCIWWIWWVTKTASFWGGGMLCVWDWVCECIYDITAASASIGDSRTYVPPQGLLFHPKSCSSAPVMDPPLPHLGSLPLANIHPVNTTVKSTEQLLPIL